MDKDGLHECHYITCTTETTFKFVFDEPVSETEAKAMVLAGEYDDITDESDMEIIGVK